MRNRPLRSGSLALLPYPEGKGFAFTIIDDTDGETLETVSPIYDELSELGLRTTKTVWVRAPRIAPSRSCDAGDTLERPEYTSYLRSLQSRGFEMAMHNVSSGDNTREEIVQGIEDFRRVFGDYPAINVHHEKSRENLYFRFAQSASHLPPTFRTTAVRRMQKLISQNGAAPRDCACSGEDNGSIHFWGDICRARIRYVRSNVFFARLDTLQCSPNTPYTWPDTPYVNRWFDSSNGQDAPTFNRILEERNVERLENTHGCCILYTHFGKGFVEPGRCAPVLNALTRERLRDVASRRDGWFVPVTRLLDRLAEMQEVLLCPLSRGVAIVNRNPFAVESLTMQGRPGATWTDLHGKQFCAGSNGRIVIPVLPAGASLVMLPSDDIVHARHWYEEGGLDFLVDVRQAISRIGDRLAL